MRQWTPPQWWPIPGPYTSIMVSDSTVSGFPYPATARAALAVGSIYRALAIYADLIGTLPVQHIRGAYEQLPPPPFVTRPAGELVGWTDEIGQTLWSLLLRGNAYLLVTSHDWTGYPATFVVLNPDAVTVERAENGGARYRWKTADGGERELVNPSPDALLHIRWQRPPGSWVGIGILDANGSPGSSLAGAIATEHYAADLMANPIPPAVLTNPTRLTREQAEALQIQWAESVARARAVPAVLSGGITYTPLQITPRDVELIESRRYNATNIAVMFGLPPMYLGGSTGDSLTYSTTEGEFARLWTMALSPASKRLERAFAAWTPADHRIRFVPDAVLRPLTLDRYNAHKIALEAGFATVTEVRALENRAPLEAPAPAAPLALPVGSTDGE